MPNNGETFVTHETCGKTRSANNWKLLAMIFTLCSACITWGLTHTSNQADNEVETQSKITRIEVQWEAQHSDIKELLRIARDK